MSMDDRHGVAPPGSCAPENYEHGCLWDDQKNMACSSSRNSEFLGSTNDDMLLLGSAGSYRSYAAGESIDPRLFALLEYFRKLYVRKGDLFRRTFPAIHDEVVDFFKKIGQVVSQVKSHDNQMRSLQRSLSVGSPRSRAIEGGESPLRLDRFKIRTVVVDGVDQGSGQGSGQQGGTKSDSSK